MWTDVETRLDVYPVASRGRRADIEINGTTAAFRFRAVTGTFTIDDVYVDPKMR